MKIGCTTAAPVPQWLRLTNGGSVIVCTRGDGTLEGLRAPIFPEGASFGASLRAPAGRIVPLGQPSGIGNGSAGARVADHTAVVPKGYKLAWEDDPEPLWRIKHIVGVVLPVEIIDGLDDPALKMYQGRRVEIEQFVIEIHPRDAEP